jgi:hypothetical protein
VAVAVVGVDMMGEPKATQGSKTEDIGSDHEKRKWGICERAVAVSVGAGDHTNRRVDSYIKVCFKHTNKCVVEEEEE